MSGMSPLRKLFLGCAAALFLATPVLYYEYTDLLSAAKDPVRCGASRDDYIRSIKYPRGNSIGVLAYCEELENEAWECRYAAIATLVLGGIALYAAFKPLKG